MKILNHTLLKYLGFLLLFSFMSQNALASLPTFSADSCYHPVRHHYYHHKHKKHKRCHYYVRRDTFITNCCNRCCVRYRCVTDFAYHRGRNSAEVDICVSDP